MLLSEDTPSDFQDLYRKHIHDNLNLQKRLRDIDSAKRKRLREMDMDARMFRQKHLQFMKDRRRTASACSSVQSQSLSRPKSSVTSSGNSRFAVSTDVAYSFKTWHALVDVNRDALDIYKSEVLNSPEAEYSGARKRRSETEPKEKSVKVNKSDLQRQSSKSVMKLRARTGKSRTSDLLTASATKLMNQISSKPKVKDRSNVCVAKKDPLKTTYLRSSTVPAFCVSKEDIPTAVSEFSPISEDKADTGDTIPYIRIESFEDSGIDEVDGCFERKHEHADTGSIVKQDSDAISPLPDIHCATSRLEPEYMSMRRRSYTIDNPDRPVLPETLSLTRFSGARRGSVDSSLNSGGSLSQRVDRLAMAADTSRGLRRLRLNTQMMRRPTALWLPLADGGDPTKEIEDIRKNCRYIRASDENSPFGNLGNTLDIDAIFAGGVDE